jgi:hypothetical protein
MKSFFKGFDQACGRLLHFYSSWDSAVVSYFQKSYNFIWDEFGLRLIFCYMVLWVLTAGVLLWTHHWYDLASHVVLNGIVCYFAYIRIIDERQRKENYSMHNAWARYMRVTPIRKFFTWLMLCSLIGAFISRDLASFVLDLYVYSTMYLICIQLRKREPRERQVFVPNPAGA